MLSVNITEESLLLTIYPSLNVERLAKMDESQSGSIPARIFRILIPMVGNDVPYAICECLTLQAALEVARALLSKEASGPCSLTIQIGVYDKSLR